MEAQVKDSYYFRHDSNAQHDERILELRAEYGWEGYGLYWALVERMRDAPEYRLSMATLGGLSAGLGVLKPLLTGLINLCCQHGLFAMEDEAAYFYAPSLRRRMEGWDTKKAALAEAGRRGAAKRWEAKPNDSHPIATPSETNGHPIATPSDFIADKNREEKNRESKPSTSLRSVRGAKEEPEHFPSFWQVYPRKESRATALKAFEKLSPEEQTAAAARARDWFGRRPDWIGPNGEDYRPHASTWLNQKRWTDLTEINITPAAGPTAQPYANPQRNAINHGLVNHEKRDFAFAKLKELGL